MILQDGDCSTSYHCYDDSRLSVGRCHGKSPGKTVSSPPSPSPGHHSKREISSGTETPYGWNLAWGFLSRRFFSRVEWQPYLSKIYGRYPFRCYSRISFLLITERQLNDIYLSSNGLQTGIIISVLRVDTNVMKFILRPPQGRSMEFFESRSLEVISDYRDFTWEMTSIFPETSDRK